MPGRHQIGREALADLAEADDADCNAFAVRHAGLLLVLGVMLPAAVMQIK
jgi:hypothetical protein